MTMCCEGSVDRVKKTSTATHYTRSWKVEEKHTTKCPGRSWKTTSVRTLQGLCMTAHHQWRLNPITQALTYPFSALTFCWLGNRNGIWQVKQEAQLMMTNLRDAFRGQSRSPNIVPYHGRYTFLLRNSNFDFKTCRFFWYLTAKNVVTLKSESEVTQGHWKWYYSIDCIWFPISVL